MTVKIKSVIHGSRALSKVEHRGKCARDIILCSLYGALKVISLCEIGGNC